jgi:tetratricopeptide (TPR) repeat protein
MNESAFDPGPAQMETPVSAQAGPRYANWLPGLLLVAATILAYQPAWNAGFIWDDNLYVTENRLLTAPDGLKRIWFSFDVPSQYFPLTYTVFLLERALWGLSSTGYHWVNILLHAANAVVLWKLLGRLRLPAPWLAAALFALHPVQVESVAWITELKNVLSVLLCLLAARAWVEFADERPGAWRYYTAALVFQALALFAKTTACTLPAALLLVLWLQRKPIGLRRLGQLVPFLAMGVMMGMVSIWWERYHQGVVGEQFAIGWMSRVLIASRALWFYLGELLWPVGLSFSYARWHIDPANPAQYLWPAACVLAGVAIARNGRGLQVAALYYVAMLAPLLGFIAEYTFRYTFVADHYQYAASIAPLALAGAALGRIKGRLPRQLASAVLLLTLGALTWRQSRMYANEQLLWETTLRREPNSWMAHGNLGTLLLKKGQTDEGIRQYREEVKIHPDSAEGRTALGTALANRGQLDDAIREFQEAIRLNPRLPQAHNNLGFALDGKGRIDEAIIQYQEAIGLDPRGPGARFNLAMALNEKGQTEEAIQQCLAAVNLKPDYVEARDKLGTMLDRMGRFDEAIRQYREAIRLKPDDARIRYNLAGSLQRNGRDDQAIIELEEAIRLKPDYPEAHNNLGAILEKKGQLNEAIRQYREAARLQPESAEARFNLGVALNARGQFDDAISEFQKAIELKPDFTQARNNLGILLGQKGRLEEAASQFREAIRLKPDEAQSHINLAYTLSVQGKREEAAEQYRQALRLNPNLPQAQNGLRALENSNKSD